MSNIFYNFLCKVRNSIAATVYNKMYYSECAQHLTHLALNSKEKGVVESFIGNEEIIVSLTTHGRRLYEVYLAIESVMQGSVKPNRIILWLSKELEGKNFPQTLANQIQRGLEVRYTEDLGPHTKLIPTLKVFSDSTIITIDDDIIYPYDTVEMLVSAHRNNPYAICANRILNVDLDSNGNPTSLQTWKEINYNEWISAKNFFEGVGGVLYPPHCFTYEIFNQSIFQDICSTADDVWFNCMAQYSKTPVAYANCHYSHFPLLINESIQDSSLWKINNSDKETLNDRQLCAVMSKYNLSYAK